MDNTFMDAHTLAVGHHLIRYYDDQQSDLIIPSHVRKLTLTDIGPGAITARNVECMRISEGYKRLAKSSIISPDDRLKSLELPYTVSELEVGFLRTGRSAPDIRITRLLDEQEWSLLQGSSIPCGGGRRILLPPKQSGSVFEPVSAAANTLCTPMSELRSELEVLFVHDPASTIFIPTECYDFRNKAARLEEHTAVMRMIKKQRMGWRNAEAEKLSDFRIRANQTAQLNYLSFALLDAGCVRPAGNGRLMVGIRIRRSQLFAPALLPVARNGHMYYLYSRLHLSNQADCPYWREDMGVFDENGLVTDRKLSDMVYAKARLLMLL